jgi:hypothetical protein
MAKVKNYINNKDLYEAMIDFKNKLKENPNTQVSNYIGQSILLICNNLAKRPNFSGYSYKQELISDGIVDCLAAISNFDPEKTNNPFAYFTQIAWNAFIRRIQKEHKQSYIKHKNFENSFLMNELWQDSDNMHLKTNDISSRIVENFENKLTKDKKPSIIGLNKFSGE